MNHHHRGRTSAGLVVAGLLLAACGSQSPASAPPAPSPTPSTSAAAPPASVRGKVRLGHVAGALPRKHRHRRLTTITRPVEAWIDRAFAAAPYPTGKYPHAFRTFTAGAKRQARRAPELTLGALGRRAEGVVVRHRVIRVDIVTTRQRHPIGATARFDVVLRTRGEHHLVHVWGSMFLTPTPRHGWRIFGYDVKQVKK